MSTHSSQPPGTGTPPRVLLVSAPDCHFCARAKAILDRLRREYPLEVQEVSLTSPEGQDMAARHGILFPPGLFLDGTCVGFGRVSERKLRRLLEQRARAAGATASDQIGA